jgi:hypothetical protein
MVPDPAARHVQPFRHVADSEQRQTSPLPFVGFKAPAASERVDRAHIAFPSMAAFTAVRSSSNRSIGQLTSVGTICFYDLGPQSGSYLELAVHAFKPLKRVQELEADVAHLIDPHSELLGMSDGKPDAVDGDTRLVRHFELHWRGLVVRPSLNQFKDLFREFALHICSQFRLQGPMASAAT